MEKGIISNACNLPSANKMTSRRNLFKQGSLRNVIKQGSLRNVMKQSSLRNVFKQGSLRNVFKSSRNVSDDDNYNENDLSVRTQRHIAVLQSLKDRMAEEEIKRKRRRREEKKRRRAQKEKKNDKKRNKRKLAHKKKKKKTKKPKKSVPVVEDSEDDSIRDFNDTIGHMPVIQKIKPSRKRSKKCVHIDMSGGLDSTDTSRDHTERTQTETSAYESLGSSQEWSPPKPVVRKIIEDNFGNTHSTALRWNAQKNSHYSDSEDYDEVSILSEEDFSEQNLSVILDCEEEGSKYTQEEGSKCTQEIECQDKVSPKSVATRSYVDLYCGPMKRISDLTGIDKLSPKSEATKSYCDLYCGPMKRISDLTGMTPRLSIASEMNDELSFILDCAEEDEMSETEYLASKKRSDVKVTELGHRSMKRVSDLTEATSYEQWGHRSMKRVSDLTEATPFEIGECSDDGYDSGSICSMVSSESFTPTTRKPISFYSTSPKQTGDNLEEDIYNPFGATPEQMTHEIDRVELANAMWNESFSSEQLEFHNSSRDMETPPATPKENFEYSDNIDDSSKFGCANQIWTPLNTKVRFQEIVEVDYEDDYAPSNAEDMHFAKPSSFISLLRFDEHIDCRSSDNCTV